MNRTHLFLTCIFLGNCIPVHATDMNIPLYANGYKGYIRNSSTEATKKTYLAGGFILNIPSQTENVQVVFSNKKDKRYLHKIQKIGLLLPVKLTMYIDMPTLNISMLTFTSSQTLNNTKGKIKTSLITNGWRYEGHALGPDSYVSKRGSISVYCLNRGKDSYGSIWYYPS